MAWYTPSLAKGAAGERPGMIVTIYLAKWQQNSKDRSLRDQILEYSITEFFAAKMVFGTKWVLCEIC